MNKTYAQLVKELDSKIPRDVVEERDGGGGRKLSYLPGHYVIDRLNKVLGHGNWSYTSSVEKLHQGVVTDKYGKDTHTVHYSARVRLSMTFVDSETGYTKEAHFEDYGYGDGTDKVNPGKAHELAIKEAITDGIKRCAKNLGMSMGLALYSKDQENVDDGETETGSDGGDTTVRDGKAKGPTPKEQSKPSEIVAQQNAQEPKEQKGEGKEKLLELVLRYIKVAKAQKKSDQSREYFASIGVNSPDDISKLPEDKLKESKKFLEELTK
jgi:recombination DNA repair RAD52 pathway protein